MIYLTSEVKQFEEAKRAFAEAYEQILQNMFATFEKKGESRDTSSPIHHRMSPETMLALLQAKTRRIETTLELSGWERNPAARARVREECTDIANYAVFIAALCRLLDEEELSR